ncbi:YfbM family protein [Micromonospora sp. NPDC005806]|uniref:YfbM family protein n=1 Tax=Micromonospora sp. NPDC005806 TaxID=3364234 RepID=UPI0036AEDD1B
MGMVAEHIRMTPAELARSLRDPEWAEEFTDDLLDAELDAQLDDAGPAEPRGYDTDKTWDALRILLDRAAAVRPCPFLGGEPFGEVWSYDRPRALTPEQVRQLAGQLAEVPFDRLVAAYDAEALRSAYLGPWSPDDVAGLREVYDRLVVHFARAARHGDGMILYLS